ncbi:MAG: DUF6690 family protein [Planctomycetota bacterium]|nr:DUF6690 family protein [Planctomycetota bacterium]
MKWILKRLVYLVMFGGILFIPLVIITGGPEDTPQPSEGSGFLNSISKWFEESGNSLRSLFSDEDTEVATIADAAKTTPDPDGLSPHLDGGIFYGIDQIINFETTPRDITNRWARISFHVKQNGLHSYRVPVVTGEERDDLAGSLTYLFNEDEELQRIEFLGYTGDASTLINVMKKKFRMTKRPSTLEALYVKSLNRLPVSALRITRPKVVNASTTTHLLEIRFELNKVRLGAILSDSFRQLLAADKSGSRI